MVVCLDLVYPFQLFLRQAQSPCQQNLLRFQETFRSILPHDTFLKNQSSQALCHLSLRRSFRENQQKLQTRLSRQSNNLYQETFQRQSQKVVCHPLACGEARPYASRHAFRFLFGSRYNPLCVNRLFAPIRELDRPGTRAFGCQTYVLGQCMSYFHFNKSSTETPSAFAIFATI